MDLIYILNNILLILLFSVKIILERKYRNFLRRLICPAMLSDNHRFYYRLRKTGFNYRCKKQIILYYLSDISELMKKSRERITASYLLINEKANHAAEIK